MYREEQVVRFEHVDGAGIVYYPRFFFFCHHAFENFFAHHGPFSYPTMVNEHRLGFPSVHIEADYKSPLAYGDSFVVSLGLKQIGNAFLVATYQLSKAETTLFTADITTVCMNLDKKTSTPIPPVIRDFFMRYVL